MLPAPVLDPESEVPLYRQLHEHVRELIGAGRLKPGDRLPSTRDLAGHLGLNRTTVSAAYELLETEGLIRGHVGRGSFVTGSVPSESSGLDWAEVLESWDRGSFPQPAAAPEEMISFATSRPADHLFPIDEFRATCREVVAAEGAAAILQLGSPSGYGPLRDYLIDEGREEGVAGPGDDVVVTNGCQQAMDLIQRVLLRPGDTVLLEDPVYPGAKGVFARAGTRVVGVPVGAQGMDLEHLERAIAREKPRLLVVTPNFQNPTGATLPLAARRTILEMVREARVVLVENDIYGALRYEGEPLPTLKQLDDTGDTVLLRSYSKLAFPGLRVGWVTGPHALSGRLAEAKQFTDLHSDQLSQAVLLRFAESGRLAAHRARIVAAGAERLSAVIEACGRYLPDGTRLTRPQGGMNLWVRLPQPLDAGELLARAHQENVSYLPGKYFEVSRHDPGGLRLSFAGLTPEKIRAGVAILGGIFSNELERARASRHFDPAPAMV
ncbi:MAG TPA: PLP-dependent aminotransferase family protein [Bryobacteraceae bacterium]|nr:PLP-dependent aminotransferase family protein [Bryobacteraceae bacterium]